MSSKASAIRFITTICPPLRPALIALHQRTSGGGAWHKEHPFDRAAGVRTSGTIPGYLLGAGITAYGAAQPSIIRKAIAAIPDPGNCHFVDLGCGKGRPLFVAAEASFLSLTGVEYS